MLGIHADLAALKTKKAATILEHSNICRPVVDKNFKTMQWSAMVFTEVK